MAAELASPGSVRLYLRPAGGGLEERVEAFRPFLWADSVIGMEGLEQTRLAGTLPFGFLVECEDWKQFSKLRAGLKGTGHKTFALGDPVQQFLTRTGLTLFKGMQFEDLRRLQIRRGGVRGCRGRRGRPGGGWRPSRSSDNKGWEEILFVDPANPGISETAALERFAAVFQGSRSGCHRGA